MTSSFYLSSPSSAVPGSMGEPETRSKNWVETNVGVTHSAASIALPDSKLGMLDNLVQQAEEVAKLDSQSQQVLSKCHESIDGSFDGDKTRIQHAEQVDGQPAWAYLQQFGWNTAKYRLDKSIHSLSSALAQEAFSADQDSKSRSQGYQQTKQQVQQIDRKFSGDSSVRSLDSVVRKSDLVQDSEFLVSKLVAVPLKQEQDFLASYETVSEMVVPRSARKITADGKFVSYSVTVFKKFERQFELKTREKQWVPRDSPTESEQTESGEAAAADARRQEADIRAAERRQRSEVERLASVTFSDIIKAWGHIKIIRVFVESVLRYGSPTAYVTASFVPKTSPEKAESKLVEQFAFLGGNAVERDSNGKSKDGDSSEFTGLVEQDYRPFVMYVAKIP